MLRKSKVRYLSRSKISTNGRSKDIKLAKCSTIQLTGKCMKWSRKVNLCQRLVNLFQRVNSVKLFVRCVILAVSRPKDQNKRLNFRWAKTINCLPRTCRELLWRHLSKSALRLVLKMYHTLYEKLINHCSCAVAYLDRRKSKQIESILLL